MKSLLVGTSVAAMMCGTSFAADLIEPAPFVPPPPPLPVYSFSGFYAGIQGGYGVRDSSIYDYQFDDAQFRLQNFFSGTLEPAPAGFIAGGHIGYLQQFDRFVVGIEGDVEYNGLDGTQSVDIFFDPIFFDPFLDARATATTEYNFSASARGRLGVVVDKRILLYATGGYAYANVDFDFLGINFDDDAAFAGQEVVFSEFPASASKGLHGYTAGAGVEGLVTQNVSIRVEYRYTRFGEEDLEFALEDTLADGTGNLTISGRNDFHAFRGGISYHF